MSDRDRELLAFVDQMRLATGAQLRRRFWPEGNPASAGRQARRALLRLSGWRVLDRLPRAVGGVRAGSAGFTFGVGPVGSRLLGGRRRRLGMPGDRFVAHTLAVTELVVQLHEADRAGRLELLEVQTEPACWRRFIGPAGARLTLKPDVFVRVGVGALEDRWMVEVDMATESPNTITGKARVYLAHLRSGSEQATAGVYPRVLWSVPDARRAEIVAGALGALPGEARRIFSVCTHEDAAGLIAEEARA